MSLIKQNDRESTENKTEQLLRYVCWAIFGIAGVVSFILACQTSFTYDEAYTVAMVRRNVKDIVAITSQDVHSPFYYLVLKGFYHTVGMNQLVSTRIFSWMFSMLTMFVGGRICNRYYGRKVECYWLALMGFVPSMLIQASTARMYTLALFIITMAGYYAHGIYQRESKKVWILFTVFAIMGVYVHTFCMITMVVVYGFLFLGFCIRKRYGSIGKLFVSGIVVSIAYLPWLVVLFHQFRRWTGEESGWTNNMAPVNWSSFKLYYLTEWFSSLEHPHSYAVCFGVLLLLVSGLFAVGYMKKHRDFFPLMGLAVAATVFFIAAMVSTFIVPCFLGRYVFPLSAGVWLLAAVGLAQIKFQWISIALSLIVAFCGAKQWREEMRYRDDTQLKQYISYMEENYREGDIIMADNIHLMTLSIYFPEAEYVLYGSAPKGLAFPYEYVFTEWKQLENQQIVWYIRFDDFVAGSIGAYYTVDDRFSFSNSYYNFVVEKMVRN